MVFADADRRKSVLGGEAKIKRTELAKLLAGMRSCHGQPSSPRHRPIDHKKCLGVWAFRPELFLAVAGEIRQLFRINYDDEWFRMGEDEIGLESLRSPLSS